MFFFWLKMQSFFPLFFFDNKDGRKEIYPKLGAHCASNFRSRSKQTNPFLTEQMEGQFEFYRGLLAHHPN